MKHVEIYGFAGSTYVCTARMVREEEHVDYQLKPLEFREESHRALYPFLRIPVVMTVTTDPGSAYDVHGHTAY